MEILSSLRRTILTLILSCLFICPALAETYTFNTTYSFESFNSKGPSKKIIPSYKIEVTLLPQIGTQPPLIKIMVKGDKENSGYALFYKKGESSCTLNYFSNSSVKALSLGSSWISHKFTVDYGETYGRVMLFNTNPDHKHIVTIHMNPSEAEKLYNLLLKYVQQLNFPITKQII